MKMHLFKPDQSETMCGRQIKAFSTNRPEDVTCAICRGTYNYNATWFLSQVSKVAIDKLNAQIEAWIQKVNPSSDLNGDQLKDLKQILESVSLSYNYDWRTT